MKQTIKNNMKKRRKAHLGEQEQQQERFRGGGDIKKERTKNQEHFLIKT